MSLPASHAVQVSASYRSFAVLDATCDYTSNLTAAHKDAIGGIVGWATNGFAVNGVSDYVYVTATLDIWAEKPQLAGNEVEDVLGESAIALPGGKICIYEAVDDLPRLGFVMPNGPGTYGVRVFGFNRGPAKNFGDSSRLFADLRGAELAAALESIQALDSYRIQLWQTGMSPRLPWEGDHAAARVNRAAAAWSNTPRPS